MSSKFTGRTFLLVASYPGSIISFRGELIRALQAAGAAVHVAAPGLDSHSGVGRKLISRSVQVHNIPLDRAGANLGSDLRLLLVLFRLMRDIKPYAILGYTVKPVIYGLIAGSLARVPRRYALITGLGYAFTGDRRGMVANVVRLLYRAALVRADLVFYQNPDDRYLFLSTRVHPPATPSLVVNGSGVDTSFFAQRPLPSDRPSFLMIARLIGDKGVREFAEAAARVRSLHPKSRFRLVGWIDENPNSIGQAELDRWVDSGDIEFLGKVDDVRSILSECTVYVLPSYREGTPRTVLEAMAVGRPIITTNAPGCRETVVDGHNGFLVPVQSVDMLADAMIRFIDDPGLANIMGRRSRRIAEDRFDVHKVNALMLAEMGALMPAVEDGQ